jgi:hypothetical protein
MSLQPLEWRKLPTRILPANITATSSYFLNTIYDILTGSLYSDGSTRVIGSGSAWQTPTKFVTGSNTEAVYLFPSYQTEMSQSVIFASKNITGASSSAAVPTVTGSRVSSSVGGGPVVYSTGSIYGALVKNASGSFTQWTSLYPFGSGSYSTGYASVTLLPSGLDKIIIYESKEAIAVVTQTATADAQIFIAGAIIDPEQTVTSIDAESDNRLYGLISASELKDSTSYTYTGFTVAFLTTFSNFTPLNWVSDYEGTVQLNHYRSPKFVAFRPQSNSFLCIQAEKFKDDTFATANPTGTGIETPIRCYATNSSNNFVGRLRDIVAIKNRTANETLRNPNNRIVGYTISSVETAQNHTVCLKY